MWMLLWMCGKTRHDKIKNDNIRECWGSTRKNGGEQTLVVWTCRAKTFGSYGMESRSDGEESNSYGQKKSRKVIREVIKKDLELNNLDKHMILDRTLWRKLIHVADPTQWDKIVVVNCFGTNILLVIINIYF